MDPGNLWTFQLHLGSVKAVEGPYLSCQIVSIYIIYIYVRCFFLASVHSEARAKAILRELVHFGVPAPWLGAKAAKVWGTHPRSQGSHVSK